MAKPSMNVGWTHPQVPDAAARTFTCGFCEQFVSSAKGFGTNVGDVFIRICPGCTRPTLFERGEQIPNVAFGSAVSDLPVDVGKLYDEARRCCSYGAYTAAVLALRKLLMNLAVEKGAKEGQTFVDYVTFLSDNHYVPPGGNDWVDHIRQKGNEATHKIVLMGPDDAKELVSFAELLLTFVYEFPARMKAKKANPAP